jgi:flagellar hook assembly protein FlgD
MRKSTYLLLTAFLVLLAIAGCATKPKPAPSITDAESSSIQAAANGLAPAGDVKFQTLAFALSFGSRDSVATWTVAVADAKQKTVVRTFKGDATNIPDSLTWDGKTDSGVLAPEAQYVATLGVTYGDKFNPSSTSSKPFLLALTAPTGSFTVSPAAFPYAPDGVTKPVSIVISVKPGMAKATNWKLDIFDSDGNQVKSLSGALPAGQQAWDGKTDAGTYVQPGNTYPAVLTVIDEFGNNSTAKGTFAAAGIPGAENSSLAPQRLGFSPTSTTVKNTLDLLLTVGSKASAQSWNVEILSADKGHIRTFAGTGDNIPDYVRWDGKDDDLNLVADGSYYAILTVDYGKAYNPAHVQSRNFSVVTAPPTGSVSVDPSTIALADFGPKNPVNFTVQAKSGFAQIATWVLTVSDSNGRTLATWNANWPNNRATWDGSTADGSPLVPGSDYTVQANVQDEYGNVATLQGSLSIEGLAAATESSNIVAGSNGFSPTGDHSGDTMSFTLTVGNVDSLASWKVDIAGEDGTVVKSVAGTSADVPATLSWDGKTDAGDMAPEGRYTAALALDYGFNFAPVGKKTKTFVLDLTPPAISLALSTNLFSPDGGGVNDRETFTISATSQFARIAGWTMTVLDPGNNVFMSWKGNWPTAPIVWDGKGAGGDLVESASDYPVDLKVTDEFGNMSEVHKTVSTDILVIKVGEGYRIRVPGIVFKPYTADYMDVPADRAARNVATLDLLAAKLAKFPDYKIRVEGHAVMINWDNKAKGDAEQKYILIPLSKLRADAIKAALVDRGINADNLTADGVGAKDPVVPDSDAANRWRNRRVEFFLLRE